MQCKQDAVSLFLVILLVLVWHLLLQRQATSLCSVFLRWYCLSSLCDNLYHIQDIAILLCRCLFYNMCKHDIPMLSRSVVHDLMLVNFKFQELGLLPGTPVGTSLIDAHAGGVGVMESISDAGSKAGCQWWAILCFCYRNCFQNIMYVTNSTSIYIVFFLSLVLQFG